MGRIVLMKSVKSKTSCLHLLLKNPTALTELYNTKHLNPAILY